MRYSKQLPDDADCDSNQLRFHGWHRVAQHCQRNFGLFMCILWPCLRCGIASNKNLEPRVRK